MSDEEQIPTIFYLSEAEYTRFIEICQNPPEPTEKLKELFSSPRAKKNWQSI